MMPDYQMVFVAFFIGAFFNRFGLYYSLGYLYAATQVTQWTQFGALTLVLIVGVMLHEFTKAMD